MNEESGKVVEVFNDGTARVEVNASETCANCSARSHCITLIPGRKRVVVALNTVGARPGDVVTLQRPHAGQTKAALLIYGVPLLAFLSGALAGSWMARAAGRASSADLWAMATGVLALAVSLVGISFLDRHYRSSRRYLPVITELRPARTMDTY